MKVFEVLIILTLVYVVGIGVGFILHRAIFSSSETACEATDSKTVEVESLPPIFKIN